MEIKFDEATLQEVGQNVKAILIENQLILVINTKVNLGPSSTGKMIGIGSTGGFAPLPGGLKGNLYIGKKA